MKIPFRLLPRMRRLPRGESWLTVLLITAVVFIFGRMLLGMFWNIAASAVSLAIHVALFIFILMAIFYAIRALSGKAEAK